MNARVVVLAALSIVLVAGCGGARSLHDLARAYRDRGEAQMVAAGNLDAAIADFTAAIEYEPEDANSYGSRGLALLKKGDAAGARADFEKAASLDPAVGKALLPLLEPGAWQFVGEAGGRRCFVDGKTVSFSPEEKVVTAYLRCEGDPVYVEIDCLGRKSRRTDPGGKDLRPWVDLQDDSAVGMTAKRYCR
jgi:tetratricopeptide (TPR) repeat protein